MELLTKELRERLPNLYETEGQKDPMVWAKFFFPDFSWTWYVIEFDGKDTFFGLVDGDEKELGYFSLSELSANQSKSGLPLKRDRFFTPCKLSELMKRLA